MPGGGKKSIIQTRPSEVLFQTVIYNHSGIGFPLLIRGVWNIQNAACAHMCTHVNASILCQWTFSCTYQLVFNALSITRNTALNFEKDSRFSGPAY